jgi:exonuclease VII small subunit
MSRNKIIEGAKEALAVARGEQPAARITVQGHAYVPESELAALRERVQELEGSIALLDERSAQYERGMKDAERKLAEAREFIRKVAGDTYLDDYENAFMPTSIAREAAEFLAARAITEEKS